MSQHKPIIDVNYAEIERALVAKIAAFIRDEVPAKYGVGLDARFIADLVERTDWSAKEQT